MHCNICGNPYILGTDAHASCREAEDRAVERNKRIDALLDLAKDDIDAHLQKIKDILTEANKKD